MGKRRIAVTAKERSKFIRYCDQKIADHDQILKSMNADKFTASRSKETQHRIIQSWQLVRAMLESSSPASGTIR